ncbi:PorV/PorQ family protein [bacterium]|nr:PorV/PorQ family protein [bacterium]MBU1638120.1 PorV/PorQ family protein [bacterium]MBU1920415.1 PorV/PorQ family protein [bacterium]
MKTTPFSRITALILLVAGFAASGFAVSKVGTTAAPFLGIAIGARAVGMGGAFVAVADDATALYWNPAGISSVEHFATNLVHTDWLHDLSYNVVGAVLPIAEGQSIGAQVALLSMPDQEITTTNQNEQDGTGVFYSAGSMALSGSWGKRFTDRFQLGLTGKYIREWIWHESASTMALDLGSIYRTELNDMRIGVSISNFGGKMTMSGRDLIHFYDVDETREGNNDRVLAETSTDSWPLPMLLRVGIAMEVIDNDAHRLTVAADALHPNDNNEYMNLGTEYAWHEQFMIRAGYKSLFLPNSEEGFTFGLGVRLHTRSGPTFGFDGAYEDFGRFDAIYKYSLVISY